MGALLFLSGGRGQLLDGGEPEAPQEVFCGAVQQRPEQVNSALSQKTQKCQIQWSPEILVYDGTSELDLMQGVLVTDEDGNDRTSDARAVLQNTEQLNQKMIYYSLNGYSEKLTDQGRMLLLENYTGPTIQVDSEVQLTVTQLGNLPGVLAERKQLEADNGYGKEITGQVSWYREKTAEGEYSIFFTVSNEFGDVATAQCRAYIDGVKDDIVLTLRQEQVSISQNEPFVPLDWVLEAEDANGENLIDGVEVEGTVNSSVPGNYTITYRLTSLDGRQCATRNLSVKVNESA